MNPTPAYWDPSAVMAVSLVLGSLIIGMGATLAIIKNGKLSEQSIKLVISLISLFLIGSLKFYAQVGTEVVTFVFGAIIGYIFSGKPINPISSTKHSEHQS